MDLERYGSLNFGIYYPPDRIISRAWNVSTKEVLSAALDFRLLVEIQANATDNGCNPYELKPVIDLASSEESKEAFRAVLDPTRLWQAQRAIDDPGLDPNKAREILFDYPMRSKSDIVDVARAMNSALDHALLVRAKASAERSGPTYESVQAILGLAKPYCCAGHCTYSVAGQRSCQATTKGYRGA